MVPLFFFRIFYRAYSEDIFKGGMLICWKNYLLWWPHLSTTARVSKPSYWVLARIHVVKDFGVDENTKKLFYSETHYFENDKPEETDAYQGRSVIFNIFEA